MLPIEQVQTCLAARADAKGVDLAELVNDMLKKDIELIEMARQARRDAGGVFPLPPRRGKAGMGVTGITAPLPGQPHEVRCALVCRFPPLKKGLSVIRD